MGCMINAADSATREVARASALLAERAQSQPVIEENRSASGKNWVQTVSGAENLRQYPVRGAHTLAVQTSGAAVVIR